MVKRSEVTKLGEIVGFLDTLQAEFAQNVPGYTILTLVLSSGINEGAITFTWNPESVDYDITIA